MRRIELLSHTKKGGDSYVFTKEQAQGVARFHRTIPNYKQTPLAELKALVADLAPDAFIIVQEAHQVLGDGFQRYQKDSL